MIDVMLFLLVFFVLISSNVLPALGLRVVLPKSGAPDHLAVVKRVTVTIAADAQLYIDGDRIQADALAARLRELQAPGTTLSVIIAADKAANMQALVATLDALKEAEVAAASIITQSK